MFNWKCAHYSENNQSNKSRMIFYATFCKKNKERSVRKMYYLDKQSSYNSKKINHYFLHKIMRNNQIYELCKKIQPIYRSITGEGNRKTLNIFKKINPKLKIIHFKSGAKVFDWRVPKVWSIKDAWIKSLKSNKKIISFRKDFLCVMGYSTPVKKIIPVQELKKKFTL